MNIFLGVIIGILVLMGLIVAHEFGHFIAARRNGVKVNEFGICFPPRAIAWVKDREVPNPKYEKGSTDPRKSSPTIIKWRRLPKSEWDKPQKSLIFSINWLPIGGFCSMDGESDADTRKHTFGAATFWQKTKILFAGVGMNWLIAFIILTILAWVGMPQFIANQFQIDSDTQLISAEPVHVSSVLDNSPAQSAGIKENDQIVSINGQSVFSGTDIINYNNEHVGESLTYTIERASDDPSCTDNCTARQDVTVKLNNSDSEYLLGISMTSGQTLTRSTWSAPIVGAVTTVQLTGATFEGLGNLLWNLVSGIVSQISLDDSVREQGRQAIGAAGDSVSGPVGIVGMLFPSFTSSGVNNLAFLSALISVSLACMNVLPIPALDGGRWLLMAIYRLRRKPLTKETEERIVSRAFIVLIALIVLITILDIVRFFR